MFIIICKIIVIVLYSVEVILVCDYVSVTSTNYSMKYWEGGVKVTKCMDDWGVGVWGRWCVILYDYCIHLEWW